MKKRSPYLSWSQLNLWEWSPKEYRKAYIEGIRRESIYFDLGSKVSDALENREKKSKDKMIALLQEKIPDYPRREYQITKKFEGILLHGRLDGFDPENLTVREDKTGKKWTQKMVDDHGQLTFYSILVWLKFGKLPKEINLWWAETKEKDKKVFLTGKLKHFKTKRTMTDIILMRGRIEKARKGIDVLWTLDAKIDRIDKHLKRSR